MLTKDLLLHRTTKGRIRPTFVDPEQASLRSFASDLIRIVKGGEGLARQDLEQALEARLSRFRRKKVGRGLVKLLLDRVEFEEPSEDIYEVRKTLFLDASRLLRAMDEGSTPEAYHHSLNEHTGQRLLEVRASLYADLPDNRKMLKWKALNGRALVDRYNLALAQGLVIYSSKMTVEAAHVETQALRKVLRWLRFCRLVSNFSFKDGHLNLTVEGPGAIFSMQKKYGLQLANFLGIVPVLGRYRLEADVQLPRKAATRLLLTEADPLVSPYRNALGHIPEELQQLSEKLQGTDGAWSPDFACEPRHVGVDGICVPDLALRHAQSGSRVFLELFHRWHKGPLERRLKDLALKPDAALVLGVDRSLLNDDGLAGQVGEHPQVFVFNGFVSFRKLRAILDRIG